MLRQNKGNFAIKLYIGIIISVILGGCAFIYPPMFYDEVFPGDYDSAPIVTISSGPAINNYLTNKPFSVTLSVDRDYGFYALNDDSYTQFSQGDVTLNIEEGESKLSFYGYDRNITSLTQEINYIVGNFPLVRISSGPSSSITTNEAFTVTLNVDRNFGFYMTNGSTAVQFSSNSSVTLSIELGTTVLQFWGDDGTNESPHTTLNYNVNFPHIHEISVQSGCEYTAGYSNPVYHNGFIYFEGTNSSNPYVFRLDQWNVYQVYSGSSYESMFYDALTVNGNLFFRGFGSSVERAYQLNGDYVYELYVEPPYNSGFYNPLLHKNTLYFEASDGTAQKIFAYDTEAMNSLTLEWGASSYDRGFRNAVSANEFVYFEGEDASLEPKMYRIENNTVYDITIEPDFNYSNGFDNPVFYDSEVLFRGVSTNGLILMYAYNGTDLSIPGFETDSSYSNDFRNPFVWQGAVYFEAFQNTGFNLFKYLDGEISDVGISTASYQGGFSNAIVYNDKMYFRGNFAGKENILEYDGTSIKQLTIGAGNNYYADMSYPIVYDSKLFFSGQNMSGDKQIYYYNGTEISTPENYSSYVKEFSEPILLDDKLIFGAYNSAEERVFGYW